MRTYVTRLLPIIAVLAVLGTIFIGTGIASASVLTSERVIFGQPYGTVRLEEGVDYKLVPNPAPYGDPIFVQLKSFDESCEDARNYHDRYDYSDYVNGSFWHAWNDHYYITCTS